MTRLARTAVGVISLLVLVPWLCSCGSAPKLDAVDLSGPGWKNASGQAVWRPSKTRPELSGDLLFATNRNGDFLVQFSKDPFAIATAQYQQGAWRIDYGVDTFSFGGRGRPSDRFSWFELAWVFSGNKPDAGWRFERLREEGSWKLRNVHSGEQVSGYLEE